jgi:hypothetical protein
VQEDNAMTWNAVSVASLIVAGLALALSLIPRLRLLDEMVFPLVFLSLTIDAVRHPDYFNMTIVIAGWAFMAVLYMKKLWVYLKRRHEA